MCFKLYFLTFRNSADQNLSWIVKFYNNDRNYVYNCFLPNEGAGVAICFPEINLTKGRAKSKC